MMPKKNKNKNQTVKIRQTGSMSVMDSKLEYKHQKDEFEFTAKIESCENCKYFHSHIYADNKGVSKHGVCRFLPPRDNFKFVEVGETQWCGQWSKK